MKKNLFLRSVLFCLMAAGVFSLQAEEPIKQYTLRFSGKNKVNNNPVSLKQITLFNLSQGCDTTFTSTSFVLKVMPEGSGIENPASASNAMQVYLAASNPHSSGVEVDVILPHPSSLQMVLYGLDGKILGRFDRRFEAGNHRFTVNPGNPGVSILKVSDGNTQRSLKLSSLSAGSSARINYNSTTKVVAQSLPTNQLRATAAKSFTYSEGDQLQLIGYANGYANSSLYDTPVKDSDYTFWFSAPYYRIFGHQTTTARPSFVDVLFSVEDADFNGVDNLMSSDFIIKENGTSVGGTSESFAYIRKMNTIPYKIQTVLVLDNSRSLSVEDLAKMKAAAIKLINNKEDNQEIAVYSFSEEVTLLQDFTTDKELLEQAISGIQRGGSSTDLYGAYINGILRFSNLFTTEQINQGFMVVFTDGDDTQGRYTLDQAINFRGGKRVYMVGLGSLDAKTLNQLANPGPYFSVSNTDQLEQIFLQIQDDIVRYANSFYWLNYMSPKRSTSYVQLQIEIKDNPNTDSDASYSTTFSASNFEIAYGGVFINPYIGGNGRDGYAVDYTFDNKTTDKYTLQAVTYWAENLPSYIWTSSDERIAQIKAIPQSFNKAELIFPTENNPGGTATITVRDEANRDDDGKYYTRSVFAYATTPPKLSTAAVTDITYTTATAGGEVTDDGGYPVTARGICWGISANPTIYDNQKNDYTGDIGEFTSEITGLQPGTTYYVRAFATNQKGTNYGNQRTFKTVAPKVPTVSSIAEVTNITEITAISGGEVTDDGGYTVTARGVCWSTATNPTVNDETTSNNTGIGAFTSNITGLQSNTTYYLRAYATNAEGTGYGEQRTFTTRILTVTTAEITNIAYNTATGGGEITDDGGYYSVTARGVCWSISANPTINDSKSNGTSASTFTSYITGLQPGTTYYVRAYATNQIDTRYGNQVTFTTASPNAPVVSTTNISNITEVTATSGGNITNDGGYTITARGVCWSTSANPTVNDDKTSNSTGAGAFTSNITGLQANTTYYVRAYATNTAGTSYGEERTFQTRILTISTVEITDITGNSAVSGGKITDDGGYYNVTTRGVCWSTSANPTIDDNKTNDGQGTSAFTSDITDLQQGTTYYVRAYATNTEGTRYGEERTFQTRTLAVSTAEITDITGNSAVSGGEITDDAGYAVTDRGVCWNRWDNPTISDNKTSDGQGTSAFTSDIKNLQQGTTYYVRAYVTNILGTAYGEQQTFKTRTLTVSTAEITDITVNTATSGGEIIDDAGYAVTARGVCWNTSANPTTIFGKTSDDTDTNAFISNITGLQAGKTYYVRAYATNILGTAYGEQRTFQTRALTINTANITNITSQTATAGGNVTNYSGSITSRGVCWSTSANPTISDSKTSDGTGTGAFTSNITGLQNSTTYYVRAYATNTLGAEYTEYGEERTFQTEKDWVVSTLAGDGTSGYAEGIGTNSRFTYPTGVAVDANENVYVADRNRIRKITPDGTVSTLAGNGTAGYAEGVGTNAQFNYSNGVAVDANGNVYVADCYNHCIRKITPNGTVSTLAGDGTEGYAEGVGTSAQFNHPSGVAVDANGNVYVADCYNHCIRKITLDGTVSTFAGDGTQGYADGVGTSTRFYQPTGVVVDANGNLYVADTGNQRIRKITPDGTVSTLAGNGTYGYNDGVGTSAQFYNPYDVAVNANGNLYVAEQSNRIRKVTPDGTVSLFAGAVPGYADGVGTSAQFTYPHGVTVDANGNIYVADTGNYRIRKIEYK